MKKIILMLIVCCTAGCQMADSDLSTPISQEYFKGIDCKPQFRVGCMPTPTVGTVFIDPCNLGPHNYHYVFSEKNGLVYTCRGGDIDIGHVRIMADWTAYCAEKTFNNLMRNSTEFSFRLELEPSSYNIKIAYPANWMELSYADKIAQARDISIKTGQYLAFTASAWHEILTWFGYKSWGIIPEYPSSFSWEDTYSNVVGVWLGAQALRDTEHTYDKAMELGLYKELKMLSVQPAKVAEKAAQSVRGKWFTGDLCFVSMKKRNFDIGLYNGYITPVLIPNVTECEGVQPQTYPAPTLDFLSEYGMAMTVEIELHEWETNDIMHIVYPDEKTRQKRIVPVMHFPIIMRHIEDEASKKYGEVK